MFEIIRRCRGCADSDFEVVLRFGALAAADALLTKEALDEPERTYPLTLAYCGSCSLVQILESVPPDVLFPADYPYYSSFSDTLLEHSRRHAEELIEERGLGSESLVVEVASNDGYLLRWFAKESIPVLGIEPAAGPARAALESGIPTRLEFFDSKTARILAVTEGRADVILANNVFAHVADQNDFLGGVRTLLKPGGIAVIEAPYVKDMVDHNEFDTIYHEHRCYFSVTSVDALARRNGLYLNRVVRLPIHGGSLRYTLSAESGDDGSVARFLAAESEAGLDTAQYYRDFSRRARHTLDRLRTLLDDRIAEGRRIAAYGATAKGATLLGFAGIGRERLMWVADRNVHKQGRFMPGIHLPIVPPQRIEEDRPDDLLLLAWNLRDEIIRQEAGHRRRGGRFIVPIPEPAVVDG